MSDYAWLTFEVFKSLISIGQKLLARESSKAKGGSTHNTYFYRAETIVLLTESPFRF